MLLVAIDGIPGTLDDMCLAEQLDIANTPDVHDIIMLPVCHATVTSLIHIVETMLVQVRQAELCCQRTSDHRRERLILVAFYWSQLPFRCSEFERAFVRRHILSIEQRMKLPMRRVLVELDKDYAFSKLTEQNLVVSTHEIVRHVNALEQTFQYDEVMCVPAHAFETQAVLKDVFRAVVAQSSGGSGSNGSGSTRWSHNQTLNGLSPDMHGPRVV